MSPPPPEPRTAILCHLYLKENLKIFRPLVLENKTKNHNSFFFFSMKSYPETYNLKLRGESRSKGQRDPLGSPSSQPPQCILLMVPRGPWSIPNPYFDKLGNWSPVFKGPSRVTQSQWWPSGCLAWPSSTLPLGPAVTQDHPHVYLIHHPPTPTPRLKLMPYPCSSINTPHPASPSLFSGVSEKYWWWCSSPSPYLYHQPHPMT